MSDLSVKAVAPQKKNYAAKGAAIALGAEVACRGLGAAIAIKNVGKDQFCAAFKDTVNSMGKGKYAAILVGGLAVTAAVGAGIGKLVEHCKAKKAEKAEQAQ